jgi:flagellar basal body-associated protein FliL
MSSNDASKKDSKVDIDDDKYAQKQPTKRHQTTVWPLVILVFIVAILGALYMYGDLEPEKQGISLKDQSHQSSYKEPSDPAGESLATPGQEKNEEVEANKVEVNDEVISEFKEETEQKGVKE